MEDLVRDRPVEPRFGWACVWLSAVAFVATLSGSAASAQTNTAEIAGIIRDQQGARLPGATVAAVHLESRARVQAISDAEGRYHLSALRLGIHEVTVELPGFKRVFQPEVVAALGDRLQLDFVLEVGGLTESITVSGDAPLLQVTTAEISDVVSNAQILQMPLNARDVLSLAQLSDAVVLPPGGTRGEALQQAGPLPNVGGQRSGHNIYLLDGVKVTDELFNNLVISPSADSVQEFKIQKSQYAAEFGGKASALINVATRAGTNQLRASVFEFMRHEAFDARGYFDPPDQPVPLLRQHQFGGAFGGPLARNRTFLFASYEGHRLRRGQTRTFSVPSEAARRGDLGAVQIDPARIDTLSAALLQYVPLPNRPGELQNLVAVEEQDRDRDAFSARLDHRVSAAGHLFARFSTFDADEVQPFGTSALQETLVPGFGRRVTTRARNLGVSHTQVLDETWMNELRVGWMTAAGGQINLNQGADFASQVGLQGVTTDPRDTGFPQVSTRGLYSTFGDPTSTITRDNQHFEVFDSLLMDRGRHRVKFGAYLFHLQLGPEQPDNARGSFTYTGQFSGDAFGDFLLGFPTNAVSGIGRGDEDGRTTWLHLFAQDDWRLRDNLTVNLGLRYEYNQHMRDARDRLSSVDYQTPGGRYVIAGDDLSSLDDDAQGLLPLIPIPYVSSSEAGWDRGLLSPSLVRLAPRTGFALALADSRAVLRGGYGIFLNQWAYSVQTAFARNLPFFYTRQVDVPATQLVPRYRTGDILTADPTGVISPTIMDHAYAVEYTQTWTGGLQYEVFPGTVTEVNYMGSWTLGADNATVRNVPEPGAGAIQARREIPALGAIRSIRFDGKSIYHGWTVKVDQPLRRRLAYNVAYTLSFSKDDASSPGATEAETNVPQDVRNIFDESGEWARSSFDHRHLFVANGTWLLPRDWRVSAVFSARSGAPFTVNLGVDRANIGAGPAQRPDALGNPNLPGGGRTPDRWFDTSVFALPTPFTFGTARRNSVLGPGFAALDVSVAKDIGLGGQRRLELRLDVFNALNRANFDLPNRIFGTPNFGRIFSAKSAREMQLGVRLSL
jgi:hypothetical protein